MASKRLSYESHLCAGHLMVWTWRKLLAGQEACPLLAAEYQRIAGDRAGAMLGLFANFLQALGHGSRRLLSVGPPHCASLTQDEVQMLRLATAAQNVDVAALEANLRWLVRRDGQPAARAAALLLMAHLRDCGVTLPPVAQPAPPRTPMLDVVWRGHEAQSRTSGDTVTCHEPSLQA